MNDMMMWYKNQWIGIEMLLSVFLYEFHFNYFTKKLCVSHTNGVTKLRQNIYAGSNFSVCNYINQKCGSDMGLYLFHLYILAMNYSAPDNSLTSDNFRLKTQMSDHNCIW